MSHSMTSTLFEHRPRLREAYTIARETITEWLDDKAPQLGASLAYYSVFSMGPLLILVVAALP